MKVHFAADYDHRWPSRAVTAFKAGTTLTVKREVGLAAIGKGRATEVDVGAKTSRNEPASANAIVGRSRGVAESHDDDHVGTIVRHPVVDGAGQ